MKTCARLAAHICRRLLAWLSLLALAADAAAAGAGSESLRYHDVQGIEIIRNRGAPAASPAALRPPVVAPRSSTRRATAAPSTPFQIPAGEQQQRDRDRLAILHHELSEERARLEEQRQQLQAGLPTAERQRIHAALHRHEQNIRALDREIGRAVKQ